MPGPSEAVRIEPRTVAQMAYAGLVIERDGRTRLGDEFRIAASQLEASVAMAALEFLPSAGLVLVTSTRPAEGKSFSSMNLAAALSETSARGVVLVDCDRKPRCLSELLGLREAPGMLDLASDESIDPRSLLVSTPLAGLSFLPIGSPRPAGDAGERGRPLAKAAGALSAALPDRTVIIDTGPLLSTSDPSVLAPAVGQIVMVVEAGRTQRSEVDAALDLVRSHRRISVLLNKVAIRAGSAFGAYYYGGGYYSADDEPPPQREAPSP